PSSKMALKLLPRFSVLNNPPEAVATYQTLGFYGSISISEIRPVVMYGPMLRRGRPLVVSAVMLPDCAPTVAHAAATARLTINVRFMAGYSVTRNGVPRTRTNGLPRVDD